MDLPSPESDQHNSDVILTILFHVYQHKACFTVHGRCPFNEKKWFQLCETSTDSIVTVNIYTGKELVIIESSILEFYQYFYIPDIHKLSFHLPHVRIL